MPVDPIVTLAEAHTFVDDYLDTTPSDEVLQDAVDLASERIEKACRVAFTPREVTATVESINGWALCDHPMVIRLLTVDGEEVDTGPYVSGNLPMAAGTREITYTHGYETPPLAIKRAVLLLTRHLLIEDPTDFDSRATHKVTEMASWSLVTPGVRGAMFPIPEVNQIVSDHAFMGDVV